jgi:hypothetical protein
VSEVVSRGATNGNQSRSMRFADGHCILRPVTSTQLSVKIHMKRNVKLHTKCITSARQLPSAPRGWNLEPVRASMTVCDPQTRKG